MQTGTYVHPILRPYPPRAMLRRRGATMSGKDSSRFDSWWFHEQLRAKRMTSMQLAAKLGLNPSAVSRMLAWEPSRRMQMPEAAQIAELFGVPLVEVMERAGIPLSELSPSASGMLTVTGVITADGTVSEVAKEAKRLVPAPPAAAEDVRALQFETAMTAQEPWDGWVLYYTPSETVRDDTVGRLCVAQTDGGELLVRFVRRARARRELDLVDMCGENRETRSLVAAAPVYWMSGP